MTTIAYRDGVIAADCRITNDGWIVGENATKLYRLDDGAVVGFCAASVSIIPGWLRWYKGDRSEPYDLKGEAQALVAYPDGRLVVYQGIDCFDFSHEPFRALGSGHPCAHAAMFAGASAEDAVRIAAKCDPNTGPNIVAMQVFLTPLSERLQEPEDDAAFRRRLLAQIGPHTVNSARAETATGEELDEIAGFYRIKRKGR